MCASRLLCMRGSSVGMLEPNATTTRSLAACALPAPISTGRTSTSADTRTLSFPRLIATLLLSMGRASRHAAHGTWHSESCRFVQERRAGLDPAEEPLDLDALVRRVVVLVVRRVRDVHPRRTEDLGEVVIRVAAPHAGDQERLPAEAAANGGGRSGAQGVC